MKDLERKALSALRFDWAPTYEDVWSPLETHVKGLNDDVAATVLDSFTEAHKSQSRSPLGVAITGRSGAGKTHLLGWLRDQVQHDGGYFFLVGLLQGKDFWQNIVHALLSGLQRPASEGDQLATMLRRLGAHIDLTPDLTDQIAGVRPITPEGLDQFVRALRRADRQVGRDCQHTARSLVLMCATDFDAQDVGVAYLLSQDETDPAERAKWGISSGRKEAQQVATEMSCLLALTGPSVLAVDQIDTLIAQSARTTDERDDRTADADQDLLMEQIGGGLMELREKMHRTLTVVACFASTWQQIGRRAVGSVSARFRDATHLARIPSADVGRALVEARFRPRFESQGFTPPYPTWPVSPEAFADAPRLTPRQLLEYIDAHVRNCLRTGNVTALARLDEAPSDATTIDEPAAPDELARLDARFAALRDRADTVAALDRHTEDTAMPPLLSAALRAWILEQGADGRFNVEVGEGRLPARHAWLREKLDESTEDERHWSFRAVAGPHHKTVINRVTRLRGVAALDLAVPKRKVYLLRTGKWSTGPVTQLKIQEFQDDGGVVLPADPRDLEVFAALGTMLGENDPGLSAWLRERRPAGRTQLLTAVFGPPRTDAGRDPGPGQHPDPGGDPGPGRGITSPEHPAEVEPGTLPLGSTAEDGVMLRVRLEALRKHAVILAGSGSGKTVLIRRLVEECALHGVSSIVLDPNNDLARLGDPWPEPPVTWSDGDAAKAEDYFAGTDVVVWTPRREAGRPLSFQPLPDFAAVFDDPDEFGLALDTAVAALAPRARMNGTTAKAERGRAVLREALAYYARQRQSGLNGYVDLLADLPDDVTQLGKARAIAEDMAQTLTAAMINDPLFGGSGVPLDPDALLTPAPGKRARISVISFIGLPSNEQRQSFVNQLQMALFSWIKRHPVGDRPLGGLFVMDEAQTLAPSGAITACTESTLALASQARKYGLGLIFATQAPRGIHNRIIGNAATQFYGFLNSPVQIAAAKEIAAAKSSGVVDISRLSAGQFYAVGEGVPFQKVVMPMCLSHHPPAPLTAEEVLVRARESP
jgi:hypothetical protein